MPVALKKAKTEESQILAGLNDAQQKAVTFGAGPLLIVAGAGTGKTTVITNRLAWLIESGKAKPEEILALTFTDKAAGEMEERVDRLLPLGYLDLWVSTFHAFGERILREHALEIGLDPHFKLLSATEQWVFLRENLFKFDLDYYRPLGNPTRFIYGLISHFSRIKDEAITPEDYQRYVFKKTKGPKSIVKSQLSNVAERKRLAELVGAYQTYQNLLHQAGYMDFGDLILNTLLLFQKRKSILAKYRTQFKYILVDEFQDTNFAQYQLIKTLAAPKNNLTVVGDDDQSIYKFRGAAISNILNFKKDYPLALEIVLTENYRSSQIILDTAYKVIKLNNPARLEVKLGLDKKLKARGETSRRAVKPQYLSLPTAEAEARAVADRIVRLKEKEEKSWSDFAILARANAQAEPFIRELERREIPFEFLASRGLFSQPEIMDLIAYLKLLHNPEDSVSAARLLHSPLFKFYSLDVARLIQEANRRNVAVFSVLDDLAHGRPVVENLAAKVKKETKDASAKLVAFLESQARLVKDKTAGEILLRFVNGFGLFQKLLRAETTTDFKKVNNIQQFFRRIQSFERLEENGTLKDKSLAAFVHELQMMLEAGEDPALSELTEGPDTVKVLTVHAAKGLEFDTVFVVSLVKDRFPSRSRGAEIDLPPDLAGEELPAKEDHLQEERRLFYVALTRAKQHLFLTAAEDYGGVRKKKPSIFLSEIGLVKTEKTDKENSKFLPLARGTWGQDSGKTKGVTGPAIKLSLPSKFSYTQIAAFKNCPRQYRFAHLLKIPVLESHTLSYGKSIHRTLADFYYLVLKGKKPTLNDLEKFYQKNWIPDWYENKKHENKRKKEGWQALKQYYAQNKKDLTRVKGVEQGFNLKVGPYTLKGAIDRIDKLPGGQIEIIDYKTGSAGKKNERTAKKDLQLSLYALAAKEVLGEKAAKLSFYFIDDNKKLSTTRSGVELARVKEEVQKVLAEIKKSDFPAKPGFLCRFCDFRPMCAEGQRETAK